MKKGRSLPKWLEKRYWPLYLFMLPGFAYLITYRYLPIAGLVMVFQKFRLTRGIFRSEWIGLANLTKLVTAPIFPMLIKNTLTISFAKLIIGFPVPLILALMLNSVRNMGLKRSLQTVMYLPHFISWVVVGSIINTFFAPSSGVLPVFLSKFGVRMDLLMDADNFIIMLVGSDIWKTMGWNSIIYLAALNGIDAALYEAATVDGANGRQQLFYITLPSLVPTIMTLLLLRVGNIFNAGFEQIFVLQNPLVYEVSEILDTYIYKVSFTQGQHAIGAAAGLLKGVVGLVLVLTTNQIARHYDQGVL